MYPKLLAFAGVAALLLLVPARANASCCDQPRHHQAVTDAVDNQRAPEPVVRQVMEVWFHRPVKVGTFILQGRYVIEHDNRRMAHGRPCTYIYAYNNQQLPVVAFECTHLERDRVNANTVVLVDIDSGLFKELAAFQFAGETAAHGVPIGR
jgi:hypothetical protein